MRGSAAGRAAAGRATTAAAAARGGMRGRTAPAFTPISELPSPSGNASATVGAAAASSGGPAPASSAHHQPWAQPGADLAERLLAMPEGASAAVSIEEMARMIEEHNWGQL